MSALGHCRWHQFGKVLGFLQVMCRVSQILANWCDPKNVNLQATKVFPKPRSCFHLEDEVVCLLKFSLCAKVMPTGIGFTKRNWLCIGFSYWWENFLLNRTTPSRSFKDHKQTYLSLLITLEQKYKRNAQENKFFFEPFSIYNQQSKY